MKVPVLLIAFNRPEFTKQVFETIRAYQPEKIYFAVDGPRKNRQDENELCENVRGIINSVDWVCTVKTLFRKENLGCKIAVGEAITWFFENEEMGIILEDDIIPDSTFYRFCEELLHYYKNDTRIGMISGDNFGFGYKRDSNSYYYSLYSHIWGWASWRRAWNGYDLEMKDYKDFLMENRLSDLFPDRVEFEFWKTNFDKVAYENFDTWDFQWVYHNFKNGRLNIMPSVNLVKNIGFGENAAHTIHVSPYANMRTEEMRFPLTHPKYFIRDDKSDEMSRNTFFPKNSKSKMRFERWLNPIRIFRKLRRMLFGFK
ncbi:glycosyl transferase [Leptospira yasudae]|uniref:glycosyl transferase n=1 Tax=Leptospira yasudae TaxID=2202201 RepID=UPI001FF07C18|nr:glycosyl transferase [Leptospira yasudae]